jgi:predicted transcriptional regulator
VTQSESEVTGIESKSIAKRLQRDWQTIFNQLQSNHEAIAM